MDDILITVPLSDYADGIRAITDLDSVRALIDTNSDFCSDEVKAILGLPIDRGKEQ